MILKNYYNYNIIKVINICFDSNNLYNNVIFQNFFANQINNVNYYIILR
jgi:hypothetical protein